MRDGALVLYRYRLRRCVAGEASMACAPRPRTSYRPTSPSLAAVPALPTLPSAEDLDKLPIAVLIEMRRALAHQIANVEAALAVRQAATPAAQASAATEDLLNVTEAAKRLRMSPTWLYRHADALPFTVRVGGSLRFDAVRLAAYLADRRRQGGAA